MSFKRMSLFRSLWLLPVLSFFAACLIGGTQATAFQRTLRPPTIRLISPQAGDVLRPGDTVTVAWEILTTVGSSYAGCEEEVYLSLDKGRTLAARLTPELAPSASSFVWTVPNLPSKKAVLDIHFGCEGGANPFEASNPQTQSRFRILQAPDGFEEVRIASTQKTDTQGGSEINIKWQSTVAGVDQFEVLASYDRGAHFTSIGKTAGQEFTWNLERDFSGLLTFKVIGHRSDGTRIESITDPNPMIVGRGQ
jgi:hypothetical protein